MLSLLKGVRVIDLTTIVLGPMATQIMADLGADVIKVESREGDLARSSGAIGPDGMGAVFANNNRNKQSIAIDLKTVAGKRVLSELVVDADVFIHNMRPAAMEQLGFGAVAVKAIKPDVIYCAATGFGSNGPYAGRPAYDDVIQAASGLASLPLHLDSDPAYAPSIMADKVSALHIVYGVLAALFNKERTGEGGEIEVPMFESLVSFIMNEHLDAATFDINGVAGYGRLLNPNRRPFKTYDGWLAVMPYSEAQWSRLLVYMGYDDVLDESWFASASGRNRQSEFLYSILIAEMPKACTIDWIRELSEMDIPHSRLNTLEDLLNDPHLQQVQFFNSTDRLNGRSRSIAQPVNFKEAKKIPDKPPPSTGEHTDEILAGLGYDSLQIDELRRAGVLRE